jgi:beta-glucanase (GH16 family)
MKRWIVGVLGVVLVTGVLVVGTTPGANAAGRRVSLTATPVGGQTVQVHGRSPRSRGHALVQRKVGTRWRTVARVGVRHHRFHARLRQSTATAWYRAVVGRSAARSVRVVLPRPAPAPAAPATTAAKAPPATTVPAPAPYDPAATSPTLGVSGPCGGVRVTKADGTAWTCTLDDEFDGTALDRSVWMPQTNFVTGTPAAHACYRDDPRNISVGGGTLNLTVRKESTPIRCVNQSMGTTAGYSAGMVSTYRLWSQQYGRFETRFKTTAATVPGLQEDFWLWPDDRYSDGTLWPAAGEIDVAELYSQYPTLNVPYLHYTRTDNGGPVPGLNTTWNCAANRGVFNTYLLEWTPTTLTISVNGRTCLVNRSGDRAFQKRYIMAFTAALGTGANALVAGTPIPATMNVDYVRAWR